jgi:hypothetical protein
VKDIIDRIQNTKAPVEIITILKGFSAEEAVSIIDDLDELNAAFAIAQLRISARFGESWACDVIARADQLQICGTRGLCHARDEVYRQIGTLTHRPHLAHA